MEPGPIVNIRESLKELEVEEPSTEEVLIDLTPSTYDAPEARYDEEAAAFLYKAGESYFAANDFENAVPCFNKLKADPKYPRAKYMFALSLCSMGNCSEAMKEYKEFSKVYKEEDSRTLEIIFASHIERCKTEGRLKSPSEDSRVEDKPKEKLYKIQFIAIYKSDLEFPRISNIGDISTEFYPNKSVYRYTLGGYTDYKNAVKDVDKVKKMGFRDAFIAVYENGIRVNTLYHSK
jgi:tetratricopeptide (TPR) repeat protein